jgi:hypothetical protein
MLVPEGIIFECGNCGWMAKAPIPKDKQKDYPSGRGYCTFNPPSVFPMPKQTSSLADVQGQVQMGILPLMLDPVVDGDKPACGRYTPDSGMIKILDDLQPKSGCGRCGAGEGDKCGHS